MRGRWLHEALHGPELPEEARQEPHCGGAASVPEIQGPGQRGQAQLVPVLLSVHINCTDAVSTAANSHAALGSGGGGSGGGEAAGAANADQLCALLVVLGDDAGRGTAVGRDVRPGGGVGLARGSGVESDDGASGATSPTAAEEDLGWRQR